MFMSVFFVSAFLLAVRIVSKLPAVACCWMGFVNEYCDVLPKNGRMCA